MRNRPAVPSVGHAQFLVGGHYYVFAEGGALRQSVVVAAQDGAVSPGDGDVEVAVQ